LFEPGLSQKSRRKDIKAPSGDHYLIPLSNMRLEALHGGG